MRAPLSGVWSFLCSYVSTFRGRNPSDPLGRRALGASRVSATMGDAGLARDLPAARCGCGDDRAGGPRARGPTPSGLHPRDHDRRGPDGGRRPRVAARPAPAHGRRAPLGVAERRRDAADGLAPGRRAHADRKRPRRLPGDLVRGRRRDEPGQVGPPAGEPPSGPTGRRRRPRHRLGPRDPAPPRRRRGGGLDGGHRGGRPPPGDRPPPRRGARAEPGPGRRLADRGPPTGGRAGAEGAWRPARGRGRAAGDGRA